MDTSMEFRARSRFGRALVVILSLAFATAHAESPAPLSLDEAVRLAEQQAPSLDARQAALTSAADAVGPAGQLSDPELVAGVDNLPVTTADAFSLTRDFMTMRKVGVMQTFTRREKRDLRTRRAEAGAERERALLINERLSVREATAKAWIACWAAEKRLGLLQSLRARADAQVAAATAALSGGRGSAAESLAAKSTKVLLEDRITQTERDVAQARADLVRWLPDAGDRVLADAPDAFELGIDPGAVLRHIATHRELLTYDAMEHAAATEVELARAEKHPDWSAEFDFQQRGPHYSNMVSFEVRIPLPLFASHRQDPMIASKQAISDEIQAEREDALRMHTAELKKVVATWRSAAERARRYEHEVLPLANDRADAALAAYRGGRGDLQATLGAFDNAVEQRMAYIDVLATLGQAWATLHFAFPQER